MRTRSPRHRVATLLLAAAAVALSHRAAAAQSGVQVTPDGKQNLISKDVGDQRWAIGYDRASGVVTGNVFFPGGGAAAFVWCERAAEQPGGDDVALSCFGADACSVAPCTPEQWTFLATVTLPAAFFEPPPAASGAVPTSSAELFAWLQDGRYRSFAAETAVHPSAGPHGGAVRTFVNGALERSLGAGSAAHPAGSAAVKELYAADRSTLTGWAVEVKLQDDSAAGNGWYWYEVFSTTDGSRPIEGVGNAACTGCHAQGDDYVRIPFPLQ